jgi:hypothetical protein
MEILVGSTQSGIVLTKYSPAVIQVVSIVRDGRSIFPEYMILSVVSTRGVDSQRRVDIF